MRSNPATQLPLTAPLDGPLRWRRHPGVHVVRDADGPARIVLDALSDSRSRDAAPAVANWLADVMGFDVALEQGDAPAFVTHPGDAATWSLLAMTELVVAWLDDSADSPFAALGRVSSAGLDRVAARDDADRAVLAELHPALLTRGDGPAWWLRSIVRDADASWLAIRHAGAIDLHGWRARLGVPLVSPAPATRDAIAGALHLADTHLSVLAWADDEPVDDELAARVAARAAAHASNADFLHRIAALTTPSTPAAPRRGPAVFERIGGSTTADGAPAATPEASSTKAAPDPAPTPAPEATPDARPARRAALESIGVDHPAPAPSAPALPPASDPGRFDVLLVDAGPDSTRTTRVLAAACGVSADRATQWCAATPVVVAEAVTAAEARRIEGMVRPATGAELRVERVSRP